LIGDDKEDHVDGLPDINNPPVIGNIGNQVDLNIH
jgi:hypothetical protein